MKAWLLNQIGGLDQLRLGEIAQPLPGKHEALLRLKFSALNPADRYLAEGQYPAKPTFPHILGRDGIGTIESVGSGVTEFHPGERVIILRGEIGVNRAGTLAEFVAVPVESLARPPAIWSEEESAGAALVYLTALQALTQWGELPPGVVLITGASGGVGVAGVQLASALGHKTVVLSRDETKRRKLQAIGATICLDPTDHDWPKKLKQMLGQPRVDLAIDNIGGTLLPEVIETLGDQGKVSIVGRLAGPVPEFNTASLFFRRIKLGGVAVGAYTPAEAQAGWQKIVALLDRRNARPIIDSVFAFEELPEAFARLKSGPMGKVLVKIQPR